MPIAFKNKGVIPLAAIKTFGVSVKEGDDAIGFFGTGLKYALAILLRNHCQVRAYIGGQRVDFITAATDIRGKQFDIVCMLEDPLVTEMGFTTELGKTWLPWMAFRELHCNTLDEGGSTEWEDEMPGNDFVPPPQETLFFIDGAAIPMMWAERNTVMLSTPTVQEGPYTNAHLGDGNHLYYRGIRVQDLRKNAKFNYNVVGKHIDLTEDRTVKYEFESRYAVTSLIIGSEDPEFIRECITDCEGRYEEDLNFIETNMTASECFLDTVGDLRAANVLGINPTAVTYHREHRIRNLKPTASVNMTSVEMMQLERAKEVMEDIGYNMSLFPIIVVEYLGKEVMGMAEDDKIYLAKKCFQMGTKAVCGTLFEEYLHLHTGYGDFTRSFQNYVIDKLFTVYEDKIGEPL